MLDDALGQALEALGVPWQTEAARRWREDTLARGWRRVLVMELSIAQLPLLAERLWAATNTATRRKLWIGHAGQAGAASAQDALRWLGQELDLLLWDSSAGVHPDALAALGGTLVAGGWLLWLIPPHGAWPTFDDPDYARSFGGVPARRQFLAWLAAQIRRSGVACATLTACGTSVRWPAPTKTTVEATDACADQADILRALLRWRRGHAHRPLILSGDRGRGKSAVLGMFAAECLAAQDTDLVVVAPRRESVRVLWQHACACLERQGVAAEHADMASERVVGRHRLVFLTPQEVLRAPPEGRVLLVDEAAAFPLPVLQQLAQRWPRVVLCSTTQGYEGSGRGFLLRLLPALEQQFRQVTRLDLRAPMRWGADDPLEQLLNRALLLDADLPPDAVTVSPAPPVRVADWIPAANDTLVAVYGLLRMAHYRTSPDDLRQLLDDPAARFVLAWRGDQLVGVLWLVLEGPLDAALAGAVAQGTRRPRGQLLPQLLALQAAEPTYAQWRYARVMRIAVHPQARRCGIGSAMLAACEGLAVDVLGASFGATPWLHAFWKAQGWHALRVGLRPEASSGEHALVMARALSPSVDPDLVRLSDRFADHWSRLLAGELRDLDTELVLALCAQWPVAGELTDADRREAHAFAFGQRQLEMSRLALMRLFAKQGIPVVDDWTAEDRQLWVQAVLQCQDWAGLAARGLSAGRRPLEMRLRACVAALLKAENLPRVPTV